MGLCLKQTSSHFKTMIRHIDSILKFFEEPMLSFANCHMVDYFTLNHYEKYISGNVQNEIDDLGKHRAIESIFSNDISSKFLSEFIKECDVLTLKSNSFGNCLNVESLCQKLDGNIEKFRMEVFMNSKKSHEVEILSAVVSSISKLFNVSHLVDIGDGKGYLSSMLAFHHKIPVVGIDASKTNTDGSVKRSEKLSKRWKGILNSPTKAFPCQKADSPDTQLYKQVTQFVDESFDFQKLMSVLYCDKTISNLGLVGLHTCGDLAPSCLKIFTGNPQIKMICNVGCCYHLLSEPAGFPLSRYLNGKRFVIGRNARMLASQSVDRVVAQKELPNMTIYYRALLQVIFEKHQVVPAKTVGKFRKPPNDFVEYSREAFRRVGADVEISDDELRELDASFRDRLSELNVFYLLRCKLSPIVESLIMLDRLLYLHEQGFENSFVVQMFDPVVSPRCYGIISIRD